MAVKTQIHGKLDKLRTNNLKHQCLRLRGNVKIEITKLGTLYMTEESDNNTSL